MRIGNRAGKRKRVIHAYDEHELRRSNRDRVTKISDSAPDDSKKEVGKKYKQYKAPDGQTFYSYAKAQEHWQTLGETPLRQPFSDASKSSKRVARLPPGWEVKAIHRDVGKRQGQVDKYYISPDGEARLQDLHPRFS
ncbi:hypothetical protein WJX79_003642 [Trebouxia sp. C0005]